MSKTQKSESPVDSKQTWPWSPLTAVAITIGLYLTQYAVQLVFLIYPALQHWDKQQIMDWFSRSVWPQLTLSIASYGLMIWLLYLFMKKRGKSLRQLGWSRAPRWKDLSLAALYYAGYFIALFIVFHIVSALIPSLNLHQKQQVGFDSARSAWQLCLVYISLAIVAPLVEETIFRGFLLGSLRKSMTIFQSVLGTSLLFGVAHLQLGSGAPPVWTAAISIFTLSVFLCVLRIRTNSLWSSVFLHAINNTLAFLEFFVIMGNIN